MLKLIAGIIALTAVLVGAFALAAPAQASGDGGPDKVKICHVTGSDTNPIVVIEVSENAVDAHLGHGDGFFYRGKCFFPKHGGYDGGDNHGPDKVKLCHVTGSETNPIVIINVSKNAVDAHLDHGDGFFFRHRCFFLKDT